MSKLSDKDPLVRREAFRQLLVSLIYSSGTNVAHLNRAILNHPDETKRASSWFAQRLEEGTEKSVPLDALPVLLAKLGPEGGVALIDALAACIGRTTVPAEASSTELALMRGTAAVQKEGAELLSAVVEASADGKIDEREAAKIADEAADVVSISAAVRRMAESAK